MAVLVFACSSVWPSSVVAVSAVPLLLQETKDARPAKRIVNIKHFFICIYFID
jgi:hypothetical protein